MKSLVSLTVLTALVLALSPVSSAQDCSGWSNWDLRGTYTMSGSGWIDLSKLVPTLPAGSVPMTWAGAHTYNGLGGGGGWVAVNAGGVQMSITFVNLTYQMNADCSVAVSYSMKVKELGTTIGPSSRILVVGGNAGALELHGITVGLGPGSPLDLLNSQRISMQFK